MNINFEKAKLNRALKSHGKTYKVLRCSKNEFGEYTKEEKEVGSFLALFHKANTGSYIKIETNEERRIVTEKSPMLLTSYDNFITLGFELDDIIYVNNKKNKVSGWFNVEEGNYAVDISLEEIQ